MNSLESIEALFKLNKNKFGLGIQEEYFPNYTPNTYLNLDFNTIDELDLSNMMPRKLYTPSSVLYATSDYRRITESEYYKDELFEALTFGALANGYHYENSNQYMKNIDIITTMATNIIERSRQELKDSPEHQNIEANIRYHLEKMHEQKATMQKVIKAQDKYIKDTKFFVGNYESFDEEETILFFDKIKNQLIQNKQYLCQEVIDIIEVLPTQLHEHLVGIKNETYKFIEIAKNLSENNMYKSLADSYQNLIIKENPVAIFVLDKMLENDTQTVLTFSKSNINSKIYLMNDKSVLYINKNGEMNTIKEQKGLNKLLSQITKDLITDFIPNKPTIAKFFNEIANEEDLDHTTIGHLYNTVRTFSNNQDIIKNMGLNILILEEKSLEAIDDYLNAEIKMYKAKQFSKKILSNKYKHLETPESDKYFKELYEKELSDKDLQNFIGKKLASLKEPEDLVKLLRNVFQQIDGFIPENLERVLNKFEIEPFYNKDNVVAFHIQKYEECKELGSSSWCIRRQESYFKTYTSNDCRQFIIYDFNKDSKDVYSMIGFTTYADGSLRTQHLKDDDYVDFSKADKYLSEIHLKAVETYIKKEVMDEEIRAQIYPEKVEELVEDKKKKLTNKSVI